MKSILSVLAFIILIAFTVSCTRKGEDDPLLSLRTRDARLINNWKMDKMENTFEVTNMQVGRNPEQMVINTSFDGTNFRFQTIINNTVVADTVFGYNYFLKIKEDGKLIYDYVLFSGGLGVKSGGEENWFWLSDNRRKAGVNLGQALLIGATAGSDISALSAYRIQDMFRNFDIIELRNKDLRLRLNKQQLTTGFNGQVQEIKVSHYSEFSDD